MAVCGICNMTFEGKVDLEDHQKKQHGRRKAKQSSPIKLDLQVGKLVKDDSTGYDRVWTCGICNEEFLDKQLLLRHKKDHISKSIKTHPEPVRPKILSGTVTDDGKYDRKHSDISTPDGVKRRPRRPKPKRQPKKIGKNVNSPEDNQISDDTEQECGTQSNDKKQEPPNSSAATVARPFSCSTCGKRYIQKKHLKVHEVTHLGIKPFKCTYCNKSFGRKDALDKHELTHTGGGGGPYPCTVCDRKYTLKENLKRHMKLHDIKTGETVKSYSCKECDKQFVYKKDMQEHERTHTGEKPFRCKVCRMKFARAGTLKRHLRTHTGERLFKCLTCKATFTRNALLVQHQVKAHPNIVPSNIEDAVTKEKEGMTFFKACEESDQEDADVADTVHVKCDQLSKVGGGNAEDTEDPLVMDSKPAVDDIDICDGLLEAEDLFDLPLRNLTRRSAKAPKRLDL